MAKKIMIIDDEQDVTLYLKALFTKNGYECEVAMNGEEGFTKTKEFKPDLITLDILMPKQTGIRLYQRFKKDEELKQVPVIVLTGLAQYKKFFEMDFTNIDKPEAFIEKPIDKELIINKIKEIIGE